MCVVIVFDLSSAEWQILRVRCVHEPACLGALLINRVISRDPDVMSAMMSASVRSHGCTPCRS